MIPFLIAAFVLAITPGPGIAYVVARTVSGGRKEGLASCIGTGLGGLIHVMASALGVSLIIAQSAFAFSVVKYVGAAYLFYLGFRMLFSKNAAPMVGEISPQGARRAFLEGIAVEALNVKTALFFLAFLPQFIAPAAEHKALTFVLLGLLFNLNSLPVNLGYALMAAWAGQRLQSLQQGLAWLERLAGALFIGFGLKLALTDSLIP